MDVYLFALFDHVERLGNLTRAGLRRAGAPYGLQPVHLQALMYLHQANRYSNTPQALAEYLGLTKGTISQSLLLLSRRELVERYADSVDKRLVRLVLSPAGEQLLKEIRLAPEWRQAARSISAGRIKTTAAALKELLYGVQQRSGSKTFGVCRSCSQCKREGPRSYRCGLTDERLNLSDLRKICREHLPKS
jgi:MarR family transcriptional regulator, organic hydroperoxide resistance regulator